MTDNPFSFWTDQNRTASFSEPGACRTRATAFEKTIRRRNALEYAAGGLVVVGFAAMAFFFASVGEWMIAATSIAILVAAVFVVAKLRRDGSARLRRPEQTCREHLREQLVRQRDLLRSVPKWYLAPFIPGLLGLYIVVTVEVAAIHGWATALDGIWFKAVATAAFFIFVAWLNLRAARKIDREIGALDRA
jgi:membrane protein implicated in regulation of membrane protease activity